MNISNKMETLSIKGFKCLSDHQVKLGKLTLLAGGNSVGKSSTIQALLLLRSTFLHLTPYDEKVLNYSEEQEMEIPLNGNFNLNLGNSTQVNPRTAETPSLEISISGKKGVMAKFSLNDIDPELFISLKEIKYTRPPHPVIFPPDFHYLNAERIGPRAVHDLGVYGENNVGWKGENTVHVLSSTLSDKIEVEQNRRFFDDLENGNRLTQAKHWMEYIVNGVDFDAKRIQEINKGYITYGKSSPFNVGFGISYVLPIVVAGLIADNQSMLIVENPEAHLHPSGQSRIGRFLARIAASGVQVVVETHSEHVLNGARIQSLEEERLSPKEIAINFFSINNESGLVDIELITLSDKGDLRFFPTGFFDQNQKDLLDLINKRKSNG